MRITDFDYRLPPELIAQEPPSQRSDCRLMVLERKTGRLKHERFPDLLTHLSPGDCLAVNDTRVFPARLFGRKTTGGRVELLLLREEAPNVWEALTRPARRLSVRTEIIFSPDLKGRIIKLLPEGRRLIKFQAAAPVRSYLAELGEVPLPPYIHQSLNDKEKYQTIYGEREGSAAAPTAGLHFTEEMLKAVTAAGVGVAKLTLDISLDTFRPLQVEEITDHRIHTEAYRLSPPAAALINKTKAGGNRLTAVGTTSVRVLETVASAAGRVRPAAGYTGLYIYPGYQFKVVDQLLTNFHLPRSSLLIMVCAFAGRELVLHAYEEAVKEGYRFFSFGDAMLII